MTDLRGAVARAICTILYGPEYRADGFGAIRKECLAYADDHIRAIEAAGYAVVKKEPDCITPVVAETSNATISEEDKRFSAQATSYAASFLKSYSDTFDAVGARTLEKAFDAMDAASPPLAKET